MKMAIRQQITITKRTQLIQSAMAKGHMKDEADITEKYSKKPEQLAAIFKNAYSFTCPIRQCKFWADPDFVTEWNFTMTENTEQLLNLETNDSAKPTKRQKTEQAPPVEGDEKVLKTVDLTKLKELFGKVGEDVDKYGASVEEANNDFFAGFIPAKVTSKMNEKRAEVLRKMAQMEQILSLIHI